MREWLNRAVSKTVDPLGDPRVRIPASPLKNLTTETQRRHKGHRKNKLNKILNKQYCNKCIKTITVTLDIKYDEKDKYKKYGTKWDKDNKTWYINGCNYHKDLNEKINEVQFEEKINFIEDD